MLTNYHTLAYIVSTLRSRLLENRIVESFSQERDQIVLRFSATEEVLTISCDRTLNTLWLRRDFARARVNSTNVLPRSIDQTISAIHMHPVDRVIMFELKSGERIDAWFFGAKANVVLLDCNGKILEAFKDAKTLVGTTAGYRTGEVMYDIESLRSRLARPQLVTLAALLREEFPTLGLTLIKEVLHRAEIPTTVGAMSAGEQHLQAFQGALASVLHELSTPRPRVYLNEDGTPVSLSLVPLRYQSSLEEKLFDDIHDAIRFFVSRGRSRESIFEEKKSLAGKLNQKLTKARRTIDAVEADLKNNIRSDEYQHFGDLLMMHLNSQKLIAEGRELRAKSIELDGFEIPLQKELSIVRNAQKYYEKAKRSRVAQTQATERLRELRTSIAPAEHLLKLLEEVNTKVELKDFMADNKDMLEEFGIGQKSEEREQLPFRIFTVDGGFEVWAGKSSKNNDELTIKFAKPNDLWFHARGAAGSHVVLKVNTGKGEPGKKAKEQAASIAAYYSKMKNAKMVPVAMTEKKYVRKPKGAAPGSVTLEREKVIFAEPILPQPEKS